MKRLARFIYWGVAFVLLLGITACNARPNNLLIFLATKVPVPFGALLPTATATPVSPIGLFGCSDAADCNYAEPIETYAGSLQASENQVYVMVPYDKPTRVSVDWAAIDTATLDSNLEHVHFFFSVDRVPYRVVDQLGMGSALDESGQPTDSPAMWMGVVLENWKVGIPHNIRYGITIDAKINNGWQDFEPQTIEYNLLVMPIAIPTATFTPTVTLTPTPTATFTPLPTDTPTITPRPIVYTPRPTVVPATATPSCETNSSIEIENSTDGMLTLYLDGPAKYSFYLDTGTQSLSVCSGSYNYTAYGCGGASNTGVINSGESHEFYCN